MPIFIFGRPTCPPHKCISHNPFRHMYIDLAKTKSDMSDTGMRLCISMLFGKREGHYPSRVLADKIYRNRNNLNYCKEHRIRLAGPALGRPKEDEQRGKAQNFIMTFTFKWVIYIITKSACSLCLSHPYGWILVS